MNSEGNIQSMRDLARRSDEFSLKEIISIPYVLVIEGFKMLKSELNLKPLKK